MFFIGINIGKTIRISNMKKVSVTLLSFLEKHQLIPENMMTGMEATGHYWLAIYSFLTQLNYFVTAFISIQSAVFG